MRVCVPAPAAPSFRPSASKQRRKDSLMPSLMELVDRVNKGEIIDSEMLEVYQESPNSAEKFLSHHAQAMLDLRRDHQHMLQSLEAIDYSDQKVLNQFISVSGFL